MKSWLGLLTMFLVCWLFADFKAAAAQGVSLATPRRSEVRVALNWNNASLQHSFYFSPACGMVLRQAFPLPDQTSEVPILREFDPQSDDDDEADDGSDDGKDVSVAFSDQDCRLIEQQFPPLHAQHANSTINVKTEPPP